MLETNKAGARHSKPDIELGRSIKGKALSIVEDMKALGFDDEPPPPFLSATGLEIVKSADGLYRWVSYSSSAYEDRDKEIVSQKALENDVARADTDKEYGPLVWWHEDSLVLGQCDYNAMHGAILIESGTFASKEIAEAVQANSDKLGISIKFAHPVTEPIDGIFHNIQRKERSLLPVGKESNLLTALSVFQEPTMLEDKLKQLKALLGGKVAEAVVSDADTRDKAAETAGMTKKEETVSEATSPVIPAVVQPATPTVGDLSIDDFKALISATVNETMATAKAAQDEAMKAQTAKAANTDAALSQLADALTQTAERIKAMESNVTQFVGDLPRAQQRGYRPIGDVKAEVSQKDASERAPQEDGGGRAWLYGFVAQGVTAQ